MRVLTHIVTAEEDGAKLLRLLRGTLHLSYSLVQSLKWRSGAIRVNGENATVARIVRFGDEITVNITDNREISPHIVPVDVPLDILYEDEDLLILNKPAAMAVHSAAATEETVTVAGAVAHYLGGAPFHPVNRLDKGVSGIMTRPRPVHAPFTHRAIPPGVPGHLPRLPPAAPGGDFAPHRAGRSLPVPPAH